MLSTSDWDWLHVKKPVQLGRVKAAKTHTAISVVEKRARYKKAILAVLADGNGYTVKQLTSLVGCGHNWASEFVKISCVKTNVKSPAYWVLRSPA